MLDMKTKLSTLRIFAMLSYLYADIMTLMDPAARKIIQAGSVGPLRINQGFLLGCTLFIICLALRWKPDAAPAAAA